MNKYHLENQKARRFFNRTAIIYPIIERALFPEYRRALRKLDLDSEHSVLDLATGTGILAGAFALRGHRVTGFDIAEKMLRRARKKFPQITFEHFDLARLDSIKSASFDIVTMGYFLHGANPDFRMQALKEAARIAAKQVIIFDYCCKGNWLVDLIEWIEGSHYNQFVSLPREQELAQAGLQVERELNLSDYGSVWVCRKNEDKSVNRT